MDRLESGSRAKERTPAVAMGVNAKRPFFYQGTLDGGHGEGMEGITLPSLFVSMSTVDLDPTSRSCRLCSAVKWCWGMFCKAARGEGSVGRAYR